MTATAPSLPPLVRQPLRPLAGGVDLLAIAQGFAVSAGSWPGMADPDERCWRTIASTDRFEAFVIAWPVGGGIELHDHGSSAGAVVVAAGSLVETSVTTADDGTLRVTISSIPEGGSVVFDRGHVHDIVNDGPGPARSIHVYSPALNHMTFFDATGGPGLVPVRTEIYADGQARP